MLWRRHEERHLPLRPYPCEPDAVSLTRRVAAVFVMVAAAVLSAGPLPDVNPLPECFFGCGEVVPLVAR